MPTASQTPLLIGFEQPLWLAALPLAFLPLLLEWLRPRTWRPAPAGWGLETGANFTLWKYNRFIKAVVQSLGALLVLLALAGPKWPELGFLKPAQQGHRWAVVLDASGSMATVDPGQSASRLARLTTALGNAVGQRPNDEFTIVRVAGYADRLGPATSNVNFLKDLLRQLRPALPGEDGTSLGDGLVLAAESLEPSGQPVKYQSILLISDGRENRPDSSAKALADVVPLLLQLKLRVDWLRVEVPGPENESPESRRLGEESRLLLESLVSQSGGTVQSLKSGDDWANLADMAIGSLPKVDSNIHSFNSAACACLILAGLAWFLLTMLKTGLISWQFRWRALFSLDFALLLLLAAALMVYFSDEIRKNAISHPLVKHRTLFLMDVSPSMAARDAADGSRLKSARRLARGAIERLSLENTTQAGLIAFSGRAVGLSPWTNDWKSLEIILSELEPDRIAPTGSSWESAIRVALDYYFKDDAASEGIQNEIVVVTDGEASEPPAQDAIETLKRLKVPVHTITFGTENPPGMTFSTGSGGDRPWVDPSTNQPARSMRHDTLARQTSQATVGQFFPVGTSRFDEFQIASGLFGKAAPVKWASPPSASHARPLAIAVFWLFVIGEFLKIIPRRPGHIFPTVAGSLLFSCLVSCGSTGWNDPVANMLHMAFQESQAGRPIQAEAILRQLQLDHPKEPVVAYNLGLLKLGKGDCPAALALFQEADTLNNQIQPLELTSRNILGTRIDAAKGFTKIQARDYQSAVIDLEKALESGDGVPELELKNIQANLQFASTQLKSQRTAGSNKTSPDSPDQPPQNTARLEEPSQQLQILANQARNRARTARSLFEPAGDELLRPADPTKKTRRMDW